MKPAEFTYHRPESIGEALHGLATLPDAKPLAGGQSLLTLMNLRLARPATVLDIGRFAELARVFDDTEALVLGALVRHRTCETDPLIAARAPLLHAAAGHIGHLGIRNQGTIGGSLAHADPAAELPLAAVTLGATVHVESAARGKRALPAEELFVSFYANSLEPDELVTWITVPAIRSGQGWGFVEYARQHGDYALAGAGVLLSLDAHGRIAGLRIGLLNAADRPLLFDEREGTAPVLGELPGPRLWESLGRRFAARAEPSHPDTEYVKALCANAISEAAEAATERAGENA
ncbi:FAD binding domain-containing protein [Sciscionella sediminilitoris]|uniref:FAD binding domain-containing protein n=1 Tax=Sciscionella sediminilitoris TaxID=1445613 RepID=UPI0004DEEDDD|nr:FAD binding domain-containing protein [Sciscionella sp. SE31]